MDDTILKMISLSLLFLHFQLSKFLYLCDDAVWGVRKACADVFMPVSCVCSPQIRKKELAPLFVNLLRDQSRWVRMTAYQALGPFISTFADSQITALLHNDNGEIGKSEPKYNMCAYDVPTPPLIIFVFYRRHYFVHFMYHTGCIIF